MKLSRLGFPLQFLLLTFTEGFNIKPYQPLGQHRSFTIDGQSNFIRHHSSYGHGALYLSPDVILDTVSSSSILTSMDAWTSAQYNTAGLIIAVSMIILLNGKEDETPVLDSKEVAESEDWEMIHEQATARANLEITTQEEKEKAKVLELEAAVRKQAEEEAAAMAKKKRQEEEAEKMRIEEEEEAEKMRMEQEEKERRQRKEEEEQLKLAQEEMARKEKAEKDRVALELEKRLSLATAKAATVAEKFEIERASEKRALELKLSSTSPPKKKDMNVQSTFQEKMEQVVENAFRTETSTKKETTTTKSDEEDEEVTTTKVVESVEEVTTTKVVESVEEELQQKKDLPFKSIIRKRSVIVTAIAIVVVQRLVRIFVSKSML